MASANSFLNFVSGEQSGTGAGTTRSPPRVPTSSTAGGARSPLSRPSSTTRQESSSQVNKFLGGSRTSAVTEARSDGGASVSAFLGGGSGGGGAALDDEAQRRKLAREAYGRIRKFMEENDVHFNGAGQDDLPSIAQAWSINHLDPRMRRANVDTLKGIAGILLDYPTMRCTVHGETGAANTAPQKLADHLGMHPVRNVRECMSHLAENRAIACRDALVAHGVAREQLMISFEGMGGHVRVDFIPEGSLDAPIEPSPRREVVYQEVKVTDHKLEAMVRELREENERLRRELSVRGRGNDEELNRKLMQLRTENERLLAELDTERRRFEAERRDIEARVRAEVERRMYDEMSAMRAHAESLQSELHRLRVQVEELSDENRRLAADLDECERKPGGGHDGGGCGGCGIDLMSMLPLGGMELGSMKRADWRRLFERLVAELMRRKKLEGRDSSAGDRDRRYDRLRYRSDRESVRSVSDRLWDSAGRSSHYGRQGYTPPPLPARRDADDFLSGGDRGGGGGARGGSGGSNNADDFLRYSSGGGAATDATRRSNDADAFLRFGGTGSGGGKSVPNLRANNADDFLRFGSGGAPSGSLGGGGSGNGVGGLASDADAFLAFGGR